MTSGQWILGFVIVAPFAFLAILIPWEGIQLIRRWLGNKSAKTASQQIIPLIKGDRRIAWATLIVIVIYITILVWLIPHWEIPGALHG